jgi:hypothetical protein
MGIHLSGEQGSGGRATVGVAALLEAGWQPGRVGVRLGAGLETAFERTKVIVADGDVGRLPTLCLRAEIAGSVAF